MKTRNPLRMIQRSPDLCGELTAGYEVDCEYKSITGVNDELILGNHKHLLEGTVSRNGTNARIIEDIALSGTNLAYAFQGLAGSHQPSAKYIKKTYGGNYDHIIKFLVFNNSPAIKLQLEGIMNGRMFGIVHNNQHNANGDGAYEVFGVAVGLIGIDLIHDKNNDENPGYEITIGSPDKAKEPHLPDTWFFTDFATTKGRVDALLS
jgi:hypothetical protein